MVVEPNATGENRRVGPEPDYESIGQGGSHRRVEDDATGGGQDHVSLLGQGVEYDLRLQVSVGRLTALLPELAHRLSGPFDNGGVDIDERHAPAGRDL